MKLKASLARMREDIRSAYKSEDTEEWWDRVFTKPLGYLWARLFIHLGWTPNMVTLLSMLIGFVGGCLFVSENFVLNLLGVVLVIWANIYDSTDGQMARLTGNKSTLGRILDALSTGVWYAAIYSALAVRLSSHMIPFTRTPWGGLSWVLVLICALLAHQPQCMLADYYRNLHLFFLKNRNGSEHDTSSGILRQRAALPHNAHFRRLYLYFYAVYTRLQEALTPDTQRLLRALEQTDLSEEARSAYLEKSRRRIQLTNILTFNSRAYALFACVLLGAPALGLFIELIVFNAILIHMLRRYEAIAREVLYEYRLPGSEVPYKKPNYWPALFFALGAVGVVTTMASTDLSGVNWDGAVLGRMHVWLPAILGIWLLIYMLHTLAYMVIIGKSGRKLSILHVFRMVISGFALNNVTPVGFAGGEPYRIMELKPFIGAEKATAAAFNFTIMNTVSHIMLWAAGAALYLLTGCKGGVLSAPAAVIVLLVFGYLIYLFIKSKGNRFVTGTLGSLSRLPLIGKYPARLLQNKRESLENIDAEMGAFRQRRRDFALTLGIEFATRLMEAAELMLLLSMLGAEISFAYAISSLAAASLIGNLIFFIPLQMGSREAGFALTLGWAGVASPVAITASLLCRIREILYLALGVGMLLMRPRQGDK